MLNFPISIFFSKINVSKMNLTKNSQQNSFDISFNTWKWVKRKKNRALSNEINKTSPEQLQYTK